jgi:hypothetical protein
MSSKNNEAKLWQKVKKGLTDCFLTRIESSTINGIPDIHAVHKGKTPLQSVLKLYRPVSLFTEPRSLVPRSSFSAPYNWTLVQQQVLRELGSMHSSA